MEEKDQDPKAVIAGLAGRFPKSRNVQEFWDSLTEGKDLIGPTRWPQGLYDLPPRIGAIHDLDKFDAIFFNISDDEANNLNPLLRHLLEVTYECVVDSALSLEELQNTKTGMYVAIFGSDTDFIETSTCPKTEHVSVSPYIAGELMSSLGLTGPRITVDTACSSSMAALNMAVNDIQSGACQYAIVTGCNLVINPLFSQQMFVLDMLSKEGMSRVFDEGANGYVRAEGCAALLIASSAEICQRVYANIIDIGINCDGYKESGITNPNSQTQAKLMRSLYTRSNIDVNEVKFMEAHGTGTQAGDKAETTGIAEVFCADRPEPLLIGSVKSNMGHSEATAALASIIKCILAMHYKEIPGNLNYKTPNPEIKGIADGKLKVVDTTIQLQSKYIGVNSFGFGGVNGHVILEPYSDINKEEFVQVPGNLMVPITARNFNCVEKVRDFVSNNRYSIGLLGMLSESMLACEQRQPIRAFIQLGPKEEDFLLHSVVLSTEKSQPICLCLEDFTGTTISASSDLLEIDFFRQTVKDCAKIIKRLDPMLDIQKCLHEGRELAPDTRQGILMAFTIIIALVQTLEEFSVTISDVLGCGLTEVIAAYIDGALNLDQCLCVAECMGKYIEKFGAENSGKWKLYEVEMTPEEAFCLSCWTQVLVIHDDDHVTMAIDSQHEEKVLKKISDKGGIYKLLPTSVPIYSGCFRDLTADLKKDLRDIIPSPKYRSPHMYSSLCGLNQRQKKDEQLLCDADYFSELICKPVNVFTAQGNIPENSLVLKVFPSTQTMLHNETHASEEVDQSAVNLDMSQVKECRERSGIHKRLASASSQSYLDSSINESVAMCPPPADLLYQSTAKSFCHTLGELHNLGNQISVQGLYNLPGTPLGIEAPFLSPLVEWDHSVSWNVPRWMEFSARVKDMVVPYTLKSEKLEGIHSPMSVLLYHSCKAISEEIQLTKGGSSAELLPIKLYDLDLRGENDLTNEMLPDVTIQVLTGTKCFVASLEDIVILKGSFDVSKSPHLPRIPGYDLDINENIQISPKESEDACLKTEIQWEDDWLSFINDIYEFAIQMTETSLRELVIDPVYHLREAKDCPAFLMVFEKYTGLCRSGGCVMKFRHPTTLPDVDFNIKQLPLTSQDKTLVSKVMVYSLHSYNKTSDKIILYSAEKILEDEEKKSVLGLICLTGESKAKEIIVPAQWKTEEMEVLVPYVIASHLLYDLACAKEDQTILILPPIDTVGVYLLSLSCQLGCSVFASTSDLENLQCLENIFPHVRVLPGKMLKENIMLLTQGQGVDVCIRLSSGDIGSAMELVGKNGHLIQCMSPPEGSQFNWSMFHKGTSMSVEKPFTAFTRFSEKSPEDVQVLLFDMQGEPISKLSMEGFPEQRGILYNQEDCSSFIQPISLEVLMSLITEPSLGSFTANLMETDAAAVENLQSIVASKPKDFSIAEMSSIRNPLQRFEDQSLNKGMIMTPPCTKVYSEESFVMSPEINVVSLQVPPKKNADLKMSPVSEPKVFPPTSTPMTEPVVAGAKIVEEKCLEESYLDEGRELPEPVESKEELTAEKKGELDISVIKKERKEGKDKKVTISKDLPRISVVDRGDGNNDAYDGSQPVGTPKGRSSKPKMIPPTIEITEEPDGVFYKPWSPVPDKPGTPAVKESSFMKLMSKKAKPIPAPFKLLKPKIDLLKVAPPMTPMNPALKDVLTPSKLQPCLVPLNPLTSAQGRPLYIVHPITGQIKLLEHLGEELKIPCYGLQRTMHTPSDSIHGVAHYYKDAIEAVQDTGPYWIAGYSFGSMIAFEIAIQLQSDGKRVEKLIMLDGSPLYVQAQIAQILQGMPTHATQEQIQYALEAGALVNWMSFYGAVKSKMLTYGILRKLPSLEDRLDTAVDLTMGNTVVSESPQRTTWLAAKNKLMQSKTEKGDEVFKAARELIRLKRKEKATDFVTHAKMAKAYKPFKKFEGDIYLHRVKTPPVFEAVSLATDYGLQDHCTGIVHLKFYTGDHESFIVKDALSLLKTDIHTILGVKEG